MVSLISRALASLLPSGLASEGSTLGALLQAIGLGMDAAATDAGQAYLDSLPQYCSLDALSRWETELGLPSIDSLTLQQRRNRVDALVSDVGSGMGPSEITALLQGCGFQLQAYCSPTVSVEALCQPNGSGYVLRNKAVSLYRNRRHLAGQSSMRAGKPKACCGAYTGNRTRQESVYASQARVTYNGSTYYPKLTVISAASGRGVLGSVPASRQQELESIVLRRGHASHWHAFLVTYT